MKTLNHAQSINQSINILNYNKSVKHKEMINSASVHIVNEFTNANSSELTNNVNCSDSWQKNTMQNNYS